MKKYQNYLVGLVLGMISVASAIFFISNGQNLAYGDSLSRMNIARKVIDNLTPGLTQLGNVWLPIPQLLMLPLIWNNFLWHSGIAGAVMSMTAFVVGGVYIYKTAFIISSSTAASLFGLSIYALNGNLLYMQSTAMSESIFIASIAATIYYFVLWIKSGNKIPYLILSGVAISISTLIRYEALAILVSSFPMIFFYTWYKTKNYQKAEGNVILYAILACLGFAIWTVYLTAIFGDPLVWKHVYISDAVREGNAGEVSGYTFNLSVLQASWKYFTAVVWMNGLLPTAMSIIAIPFVVLESIKRKSFYFLPILISLSMFTLMIYTLQRNTPINQPDLTIANIISPNTSNFPEFNIRYGLILLPIISLLCVYLFNVKSLILKILLVFMLGIQLYSYISPRYSVIYQLPITMKKGGVHGSPEDQEMVQWLRNNYDGGLIMISALKHDPQMLQFGFDYKTYIHEGTGKYWKESIVKPEKHATWLVFDPQNKQDQVTKFVANSSSVEIYFDLVYSNKRTVIYKIKPDAQIDRKTLE